jgi:hypothetical protein
MRRIATAALFFLALASCGYRPAFVDGPVVQPHLGSALPRIAQVKGQGQSLTLCREISRSHCDTATCKGRAMDLVTFSCSGSKVSRCEIGKGGC